MTNYEHLKRTVPDSLLLDIMSEAIGVLQQNDVEIVICCNSFMCKQCKFNNANEKCSEQARKWLMREREETK